MQKILKPILIIFVGLVAVFSTYTFLRPNEKLPTEKPVIPVIYKPKYDYNKKLLIGEQEISVELANTPQDLKRGLSGQDPLEESQGMLFDFGYKDTIPGFWMKDMQFAIDIIWINDGKVVGIEKNVQPEPGKSDEELTKYFPPQPIDYVLEVIAGYSDKNSLKIGDAIDLSYNKD